ncbi:MAG: type II toxin-antitoxin system PemK/MazF family toxin [Microbacterium sp.]|uniref:type II toxin-antitoxin system PemK/MazF family toxin n=1 Tax=Microbacterium sp. TaxID=51671 RepID=UPI001AC7A144|nr:type II toxin-antitoxin system PemK/MazF family toxin [Microbacterium sp.]MBN9177207.1 type II toxin-antitoxin system PemK/MazF family toxin [Microbacterium sp.]
MAGRSDGYLAGLLKGIVNVFTGGAAVVDEQLQQAKRREDAASSTDSAGQHGRTATIEIAPPRADGLRITYAPERDGDPDAGEVVWTWVPYEENDGRGKDRPVLVVGRQSADRVFAVRLTSKAHDGNRDYLPIGSGAWDSQGRPSWVDIERLYSVHHEGMRREASAIDLKRFAVVAQALQRRYGWQVGE